MGGHIAQLELERDGRTLATEMLACEQRAALHDLLVAGTFQPAGDDGNGPYAVRLGLHEGRLVIAARNAREIDLPVLVMSLRPYRKVIDDYFVMIRSFEEARRYAGTTKLEAIDMGRRGLHNEGAALLQARLEGKIAIDFETARRLFTLICALHRDQLRTMG